MKDFSYILEFVKKASIFDIFLISFLLLPFVLQAWIQIFTGLGYPQSLTGVLLILVVVLYVVGIALMLVGVNRRKIRELARNQVLNYLQSKDFQMMSFDRVREKINKAYSDAFLMSVIAEFPHELRPARLKGGKAGIARLMEETVQGQDA